jgi:DNA-binding GntR family transcriptional regulator
MKTDTKSTPEHKTGLTRKAYNVIRRMIFLNEFKPGQKIPYREMASRIDMSLTPVVQALKHMEFLGLIRHEPNRGFFVNTLTAGEVAEVYELRELLEIHLIPKIIANLDGEAEKQLQTALDAYLEASHSGSLNLRLSKDMNFHMTLAEMSGEAITIRLLRYLLDFLYLRFEQELIFSRPQKSAAGEHQRICERIFARDVSGACEAMRHHIHSIRDNALRGIQKRLKETEEIDI